MTRRTRWLERFRRVQRLAARRSAAPGKMSGTARPWHMPSRIVLRFRDGSSVMLDPESPTAIEIHRIADAWLAGR